MSPRARKLALTAHVSVSVGWAGAVAVALVLALAGVASSDVATVRGAYVALDLIARFVLVPLAFASLVTGVIQSLGTTWGLIRHYWVIFKLFINLFATVVLLLYLPALREQADAASAPAVALADVRSPSAVLHAAIALPLLLLAAFLGIYKPRGVTRYGHGRTADRLEPERIEDQPADRHRDHARRDGEDAG